MSEAKNQTEEGLEVEQVAQEATKTKREQKPQTAEEKAVLIAGVTKMTEIGLTPNFQVIVEAAPSWNDPDKAVVDAARKKIIAHFGEGEKLKDYLETEEFKKEFEYFQGIAKTMPTVNVIRSYYQRRANAPAKKVKLVNVSINQTPYVVSAEVFELAKAIVDKDERRAFVLNHPDTKPATVEEF